MIALLAMAVALVAEDATPLRASPRESAPVQAQLYKGDWLEVRAEERGWLKVWDHRRERPGYVQPGKVRNYEVLPASAPALLAVVDFLRHAPGQESLGIGAAALALRCDAKADVQGAIGEMADRLARRMSEKQSPQAAAHREVLESYGVRFLDVEQPGRVRTCYDGAAFRRVIAAVETPPADRARAALALTGDSCVDPRASPGVIKAWNEWRLDVLSQIDAAPAPLYGLVRLRKAEVLSALVFQAARESADPAPLAQRAIHEIGATDPGELAEDDLLLRARAALEVASIRWAVETPAQPIAKRPHLVFRTGEPGETCIGAVANEALQVERCTYGVVWRASAAGRGLSLAVSVQPRENWTELWVARRTRAGWRIDVIPPGQDASSPGYAELAGFSPDGTQLLVARETLSHNRLVQRFETRRASDLRVLKWRASPDEKFSRWSDPSWRTSTLALR